MNNVAKLCEKLHYWGAETRGKVGTSNGEKYHMSGITSC